MKRVIRAIDRNQIGDGTEARDDVFAFHLRLKFSTISGNLPILLLVTFILKISRFHHRCIIIHRDKLEI